MATDEGPDTELAVVAAWDRFLRVVVYREPDPLSPTHALLRVETDTALTPKWRAVCGCREGGRPLPWTYDSEAAAHAMYRTHTQYVPGSSR